MRDRLEHLHERVDHRVDEMIADVKPHLRGWLHAATAPLTLAAGIVLIALSPTASTRIGSAVFTLSALVLFTVSAVYHRGRWSPGTHQLLKRLDHSNIFVLIAGSCTPFALLLLEGGERWAMLAISWGGALAGVFLKVVWLTHPRWLSPPIYIALGWAPVFFLGDFLDGARSLSGGLGVAVLVLVAVGGRVRRPAAEPVAPLVRVPRGLPLVHNLGLRHPLRGRLAGDVLAALTSRRPAPRSDTSRSSTW